jgi:hypothetical protein
MDADVIRYGLLLKQLLLWRGAGWFLPLPDSVRPVN